VTISGDRPFSVQRHDGIRGACSEHESASGNWTGRRGATQLKAGVQSRGGGATHRPRCSFLQTGEMRSRAFVITASTESRNWYA
jgi:hypothetical protein